MFWGFSESLDLYAEYLNAQKAHITAENTRSEQNTTTSREDGAADRNATSTAANSNTNDTVCSDTQTLRAVDAVDENYTPSAIATEEPTQSAQTIQRVCDDTQREHTENPKANIECIEANRLVAGTEQHLKLNDINFASGDAHPTFETQTTSTNEATEKIANVSEQPIETVNCIDSSAVASSSSDTQSNHSNDTAHEHTIPPAIKPEESLSQVVLSNTTTPAQTLNILLFGAGDPRHLIKTLAKLYTHVDADGQWPFINFYVLEGCTEIVARSLTLLSIALESADTFNLLSKVHLFMDVYGNLLLRPSSHQYLVGKSKALLKLITDDEALQKVAPLLNLDNLKYRERDGLDNMFNFMLPKEGHIFDVQTYWTQRLRKHLTRRYDYREGAFDWDLNMVLKDRNGAQICSQEYRYWRETGIAFTYPEYEQCKPNKTLSVGLVRNGEKFLHRGYAGDIQTGPFSAFGLKCDDPRMLKSIHGENDYRATDVTERNLLEYFHELQTATPYKHNTDISRKYGSVKLLMGNRLTWNECDVDVRQEYEKPWLNVKGAIIHFLSADEIFALQNNEERWRESFDVAFVGHNYFPFVKESFSSLLKNNALLMLETKLMTVARKEEVNAFEDKLKNFAKSCKLKPVINYNTLNTKNSILKFKKCKQS